MIPTSLIRKWFLIFAFMVSTTPVHASEWRQVKNDNGVVVHTRKQAGTDFDAFRGKTVINAPLGACLDVLLDVSQHTKWLPDTKVARRVRYLSQTDDIIYNVTDAPWPLNDRDMVLRRRVIRHPDTTQVVEVVIESIEDVEIPKNPDRVRIMDMEGRWTFKSISETQTEVTYTLRCDPGGRIPAGIANMTSRQLPIETLNGMRRMVSKHLNHPQRDLQGEAQ